MSAKSGSARGLKRGKRRSRRGPTAVTDIGPRSHELVHFWPAYKRVPFGWERTGPAPGHHARYSVIIRFKETGMSEEMRKALIDDPPRLLLLARSSGETAAQNGQPRCSPFYAKELTAEWFAGFDGQMGRQRKARGGMEPQRTDGPIDPRAAAARAAHRAARRPSCG